jgi:hypothetical protein
MMTAAPNDVCRWQMMCAARTWAEARLCLEMNPVGILEMHFVLEIRFQRLKSAFGR